MVNLTNGKPLKLNNIFVGLKSLGYSPIIHPSDYITVVVEENLYAIMLDSLDSNFLQILLPSILNPDQIKEGGLMAVYEACNAANSRCKLARCFISDDYASCSLDSLADNVNEFVSKFKRYISALQYCKNTFAAEFASRVNK